MPSVCVAGPPRPASQQARTEGGETLRRISDDLLDSLDGSLRNPPVLSEGWERRAAVAPFRDRVTAVIGDGRAVVWEDPHAALLLPFWNDAIPGLVTVVIVSDPDAIVARLVREEAISVNDAATLWLRHLLSALRDAHRPVLVTTDDVRDASEDVVARVREVGGDDVDAAALRASLMAAVTAESRDVTAPAADGATASLARAVRRLLDDPEPASARALADVLHERWVLEQRLVEATSGAEATARALADERERGARLTEEVARLSERLRDAERRWAGTARAATAREDELARENQRLRAELQRFERHVEEIAREHDRLRRRRVVRAGLALADALEPLVRRLRSRREADPGGVRSAGSDRPAARVYAVILNYRHAEDTIACLDALAASTVPQIYPLVVDNGSGEETVSRLRESIGPRPLLDAGENLGYAAGNNLGIQHALERDAELVWILNPDALVEPDCLERLLETLEANPDAGIVGARVLNGGSEPLTIATDGGRISWDEAGATDHLAAGARASSVPDDETHPCDYVPGVCMLVRRAVFEDVGLLPEDWFLYFEETDFNLRVSERGWRLLIDPRARVHHHKRSSGRLPSPYYVYYFVRNRLLFARRHVDAWDGGIPSDLERWIAAWREKVDRADASWLGTYDRLVAQALEDGRAGVDGRRPEIEEVAPGAGHG